MNWFHVIKNDNTVDDPMVIDGEDFGGFESEHLRAGIAVDGWTDDLVMRVIDPANDGQPDDALQNHLGLLVFSGDLRRALERAQVRGLQFLPVGILNSTGRRSD